MIFVDTSFWIALRNRQDGRHRDAGALLRRYSGRVLVTSNQIRGETWTYLRHRAGQESEASKRTLDEIWADVSGAQNL